MLNVPRNLLGWLILALIAVAATLLSPWLPGPGTITIALVLAIVIGNVVPWKARVLAVFKYAEKHLLALATVFLGFGLNIRLLQSLSPIYLLLIVFMVVLALASSQLYCGAMRAPLRWLLGAGSGICGNSAIAATAPALGATVTEIGLAVTVVNLLGTVGIFLFPALAEALQFSTSESALFTGAILQSVGHVVAAGYSIDQETGALALLIKMGRILMLGPIILYIGYRFKSKDIQKLSAAIIPNYVWGFLIAAVVTSTGWVPSNITTNMEKAGSYFLLLAMSGIGLGINLKQMLSMGPRAALSGTLIFLTQIVVLIAILLFIRQF